MSRRQLRLPEDRAPFSREAAKPNKGREPWSGMRRVITALWSRSALSSETRGTARDTQTQLLGLSLRMGRVPVRLGK